MEKYIEIAKSFHDTYEKLAPKYGYKTRDDTKVFDPFSDNGRLMIEVVYTIITQVEQQAYKRVIDIVKEHISDVITLYPNATLNPLDEITAFQVNGKEMHNKACRKIIKAIEDLIE